MMSDFDLSDLTEEDHFSDLTCGRFVTAEQRQEAMDHSLHYHQMAEPNDNHWVEIWTDEHPTEPYCFMIQSKMPPHQGPNCYQLPKGPNDQDQA